MSGVRSIYRSEGCNWMKPRIAVIGSTLEGVACAHSILDQKPEYQISLITEDAEVGFPEGGESPGLVEFKEWGGIPEDWYGNLGSQQPNGESSAVRRSWLLKSLMTCFGKRGGTILLRGCSVSVAASSGSVFFQGGGEVGSGSIHFEQVVDCLGAMEEGAIWNGGVCDTIVLGGDCLSGIRADGTVEVWWCESEPRDVQWIQRMSWTGDDPTSSLIDDIRTGVEKATIACERKRPG